MNKAEKIGIILLGSLGVVVTSYWAYNRYLRFNNALIVSAVTADLSSLTDTSLINQLTTIYTMEINNILNSFHDANMICYVATADSITPEQQLVNTAKARLISNGYLTTQTSF